MRKRTLAVLALVLSSAACDHHDAASGDAPVPAEASAASATAPAAAAVSRADFNRYAMRLGLPVFWVADANGDGAPQPGELKTLLFYPSPAPAAADSIARVLAFSSSTQPAGLTPEEAERRRLVALDLDQGAPTLLTTDLRPASAADKAFFDAMLGAAAAVDALYETMNGARALESRVPADDPASRSLFRRNRGPRCAFPATHDNPACSAIPGSPRPIRDEYPAALQASDPGFCATLEKAPNARDLIDH